MHAPDPSTGFQARELRRALGHFTTGVTVVTAVGTGAEPVGLTVNSFNAVSLDPPLVLFSVARHCRALPVLRAAAAWAVNVLRDDQSALSRRFAGTQGARWQGVEWRPGRTGSPLLVPVLAAFECEPHARHDGGDHEIFVGRVVALVEDARARPLLFFRGGYGTLASTVCEAG